MANNKRLDVLPKDIASYHEGRRYHRQLGYLLRQNFFQKTELPNSVQTALTVKSSSKVKEILQRLHSGEVLLSVRRRRLFSEQHRFCRLDKDNLFFRHSSHSLQCGRASAIGKRREKKIDLRRVHVRLGAQEKCIKSLYTVKSSNCFSIVFDNSPRLPLCFVAEDQRSAEDWVTALNFLRRRLTSFQPRIQFDLTAWELFNSLKSYKKRCLTSNEAKKYLSVYGQLQETYHQSVNMNSTQFLPNQQLNFHEFLDLYRGVHLRPEVINIFNSISADHTSLTVRELYRFLQDKQRVENVSLRHCEDIINAFEFDDVKRTQYLMSVHGFNLYMTSSHCELFNTQHDKVYQDMNQPLSHYYIASSHNTYLLGDQITEASSVDAYMNVLLKGCRCVELDCWDGPDGEPLIYHGYTLTSKIKFKDVVEVIGRYAFETSQYPLILSLENHCTLPQQEKMAFYLKTILGSEILSAPLYPEKNVFTLPSPYALRGKILIKGKTLSMTKPLEDENDESEAGDALHTKPVVLSEKNEKSVLKHSFRRNKSNSSSVTSYESTSTSSVTPSWKISPSLSRLVIYCKSVKFSSFDDPQNNVDQISSFPEGKSKRFAKNETEKAIEYHKWKLSRTYPSGSRTDSSNYDPQPLWNAGFQIVTLNYQTQCDEMDINSGKFRQNGNCGYVLKPPFQRLSRELKSTAKTFNLYVISGPKNNEYDYTLELVVSGQKEDNARRSLLCHKKMDASVKRKADFELTIQNPELTMLRFFLKDTNKMREKLGQYTLPFTSVAQGYRHIPFTDNSGNKMPGMSVIVFVELQ